MSLAETSLRVETTAIEGTGKKSNEGGRCREYFDVECSTSMSASCTHVSLPQASPNSVALTSRSSGRVKPVHLRRALTPPAIRWPITRHTSEPLLGSSRPVSDRLAGLQRTVQAYEEHGVPKDVIACLTTRERRALHVVHAGVHVYAVHASCAVHPVYAVTYSACSASSVPSSTSTVVTKWGKSE
jgi:hypothetical protein